MRKPIILSLLLFVFLAGCVQSNQAGGPGVIIKAISAYPSTAEPDTSILLQVFVQNTGGVKATDVEVELLGLTDEWTIEPTVSSSDERIQNIGDLYPPDPSRGITTGEEREVIWDLTAPGKAVDVTYDATAHLSYDYETTLEAQIKAVTSEYFKQTAQGGGIEFQAVSSGPISIKVIAPNTIIAGGRLPLQFAIQNIGSGKVTNDELTFTIDGEGFSCTRTKVRLIKGASATLSCTITTGSVTNYKIFPVSLETSYSYWVESPTSITVLKTSPF